MTSPKTRRENVSTLLFLCFWTKRDQLAQPTIDLRLGSSGFVYAPHDLRHVPMARLMDVGLDSGGAAGWIPAALTKSLRRQLRSATRQKKGHVMQVCVVLLDPVEVLVECVMVTIELTTFGVKAAPQQLGSRGGEADKLDPPPMAPLAKCLRLLQQASRGPVAQTQPYRLRDTASRLEENASNALFAQTPADTTAAAQDPRRELRIIDDLGNP